MDFGDSGELYTIRNQFYTGQFTKVKQYVLDQFNEENQLKVLELQVRSAISLGQDASKIIDDGKNRFPDNDPLFQLMSAWNDLNSFGTDNSPYFEDMKVPEFELQAILTTYYLIRYVKDIDQAITFLNNYIEGSTMLKINELEPYLILIQLYLVKGNFAQANKIFNMFKNFPDSARDDIIYHVLESWILSIKGESDNINNSFFFYDELLSNDFENDEMSKFNILNVLFTLTIQLKHYPEAAEIYQQMLLLKVKENDDFIANQITLNYLTDKANENPELITKLTNLNPDHHYIVEHNDKLNKFNEIVTKYKQ